MGDLISRTAVIELIENCHVLEDAYCLVDYINELETAYDVEKAIQQLEENKTDAIKTIRKVCDSCFAPEQAGNLVELLEVYTREQIEIVKKGGVLDGKRDFIQREKEIRWRMDIGEFTED